ncbi:MAG: cyclase family protein [Verrucomicrobiota bacterium]
MKKWIDISMPLQDGMVHWPGDPECKISLAVSMADGKPCNLTHLSMSAHTSTHMDAPRHFVRDGRTMESMPLDATIGPCRVIEIKHKSAITVDEVKPHKPRKGERVLFKTRNSTRSWNLAKTATFDEQFVYIPASTAQYLVDCGIQTVGVDYLSVGGWQKDGIECHQILLGAEVWIIEGLNLSKIKPGKYELMCLPLKIVGADGAPARAILR